MEYEGGELLFETLHADWPVYPAGHGWQIALKSFACFPPNVLFQQIDDMDQCYLFVVLGNGPCLVPRGDLYDPKWFHVAVWHEDILQLHRMGLVHGVSVRTKYEAALDQHNRYKDYFVESQDGFRKIGLPCPDPNNFEGESPFVELSPITLASEADETLLPLAMALDELSSEIGDRVRPLLAIPMYDTAIREASIILESRIREITRTESYGQMLVDEYYQMLCAGSQGRATASMKVLRGELRTLFKFVRNDFAHSLRQITMARCQILLDRISRVLTIIAPVKP